MGPRSQITTAKWQTIGTFIYYECNITNMSSPILRDIVDKAIIGVAGNYQTKNLYSKCGTASARIQRKLREQGIDTRQCVSNDPQMNAHVYLIRSEDQQVDPLDQRIIDATAGMFLLDYEQPFIGTRRELRDLIMSKEYEITNTSSRNDPKRAFERTWGNTSNFYGNGG